jgi:hypothetical protein
MPGFEHGAVDDVLPDAITAGPAGATVQRRLLPDSDEWDFDVLVLDVKPGASPPEVVGGWLVWGVATATSLFF